MNVDFQAAERLLQTFKGDACLHGTGILGEIGPAAAGLGQTGVLVADRFPGSQVYQEAGYILALLERLAGRELGWAVAEGMIAFAQAVGFPTRLADVPSFSAGHIERALAAAKNPQLKMKLENMPVPMTAEMVDDYMRPFLQPPAWATWA